MFRDSRQQNLPDSPAVLEKILQRDETFICIHSKESYWKLYFALTGGAK